MKPRRLQSEVRSARLIGLSMVVPFSLAPRHASLAFARAARDFVVDRKCDGRIAAPCGYHSRCARSSGGVGAAVRAVILFPVVPAEPKARLRASATRYGES